MSDTRKHLFNLDGTHNSSACWCEPVKPHTYTESEVREMVAKWIGLCSTAVCNRVHDGQSANIVVDELDEWAADIRSGKEDL